MAEVDRVVNQTTVQVGLDILVHQLGIVQLVTRLVEQLCAHLVVVVNLSGWRAAAIVR